jgi:hypothetical protein
MIREGNAAAGSLINGRIAASRRADERRRHLRRARRVPAAGVGSGADVVGDGAGLIPSAHIPIYTPLPINGVLAPQAYRVILSGIFTSVATSGTLTMTPRIGNANTSPSLGASAAQTLTASLTNGQFYIMGDITIRTIGLPGANSTAIATFHALANSAVGGATTSWLWGTGTTAVSFDSTIAAGANGGGFWLGVTFSANFPTMTLQQVHLMDWN